MTAEVSEVVFPIDIKQAEDEIFNLVKTGDLSELTSAKIRQSLKEKFNADFDPVRKQINEMTRVAIEKLNTDKVEPATTSDKKDDSDSDSDDMIDDMKKSRKRKAEPIADLYSERRPGRAAATKAKQDIRKSTGYIGKRKDKKKAGEEKPKKDMTVKFGKMTKLCWISPELATVVGVPYSKRCDVVSKMWAYVREHDLFLPTDKRFAICDETLMNIFKKKKFRIFSMSKDLAKHIKDPAVMGSDYVAEAEEFKAKLIAEYEERMRQEENGSPTVKKEEESEDGDDDDGDEKEETGVSIKEEGKEEEKEQVYGVKEEIKEEEE